MYEPKNVDRSGIEDQSGLQPSRQSDEEHQQVFEEVPSVLELLKNKDVLGLVVSNFAMCLISELLFNIYPLFAYTPIKYGTVIHFCGRVFKFLMTFRWARLF
jgi:hypothetical protein